MPNLRTLSREEVQEVKEILRKRHPLYYAGTRIGDLFPFLDYLSCGGNLKSVDLGKREETK